MELFWLAITVTLPELVQPESPLSDLMALISVMELPIQLLLAQVVLILGGMYAAYSGWIEYEISEAQRLDKTIIGIKPWGQERVPQIVQDASICDMVGWNSASVVQAVRDFT